MAAMRLLVAAAVASVSAAARGRAEVTPIGKVLEMMNGMLQKGKDEKHAEEVEFAKTQAWCDSTKKDTQKNIDKGADAIVQLGADVAKAKSDAEGLAEEVKGLQGSVAEAIDEQKKATAVRKKERADYSAQHKDFSDSIDAVERAVHVLKARSADVAQSLAQVKAAPFVPDHAKQMLESFLDFSTDTGAPEANAYENQSGSVVDMLEKLAGKFKAQRTELEQAELNAKGNFGVLDQQLTANIKNDGESADAKTAAKAQRLQDASVAAEDLEITQKGKAGDEDTLSDTNVACHAKAEEFEKNQVTRADEIKAITKAVEILSSDEVSGAGDKHLPSAFLQAKKAATSFAMLRSEGSQQEDKRAKVVAYLQARSEKLESRYLAVMASHAAADPFEKVKKMIKDLIVKLSEQANEEADHNAYCTTELATNKQTRDNKGSEVEELSAKVDELTSTSAQLSEQISALSDEIAEIKGQQSEATKNRIEEKTVNTATISEAKGAQEAVERAIEILRNFYTSKQDASAAVLQARAEAKAKEPYQGMQSDNGGIMGMLDVILSDFARLESDTSANEDQAAAAHERFMNESTQDAEVKETEMKHKESNKQDTEETLRSTKKDFSLTQEELNGALDYFEKLKADCTDKGLSYEDRVKGREEEIQSLKEALEILG